jgi:hypothetical protein
MKAGDIVKSPVPRSNLKASCPFCGETVIDNPLRFKCGCSGKWCDENGTKVGEPMQWNHIRIISPCSRYVDAQEQQKSERHPCTCSRQTLFAKGCQCGGC